MTANTNNTNSEPAADLDNLLGRAAITAANQNEQAGDKLAPPSQAQWQAFIANKLSDQQAEPICAWLNSNPEAYERWLATEAATAQSLWQRLSGWLAGPQWAAGGLATAMALVLAVTVVWQQPGNTDPYGGTIASYSSDSSDQQRRDVEQATQLPWEQDTDWALTATAKQPEQQAFSDGFIAMRSALVGASDSAVTQTNNEWFDFGRWHALVSVALVDQDIERRGETLQWAATELQRFQASLDITDELLKTQLQQHLATLQRSLSNDRLVVEPRLQRRLAKELDAGRRLFAAAPALAEG